MASFRAQRDAAWAAAGRREYARTYGGLNALERHKKLLSELEAYQGQSGAAGGEQPHALQNIRTDADMLKEHYRWAQPPPGVRGAGGGGGSSGCAAGAGGGEGRRGGGGGPKDGRVALRCCSGAWAGSAVHTAAPGPAGSFARPRTTSRRASPGRCSWPSGTGSVGGLALALPCGRAWPSRLCSSSAGLGAWQLPAATEARPAARRGARCHPSCMAACHGVQPPHQPAQLQQQLPPRLAGWRQPPGRASTHPCAAAGRCLRPAGTSTARWGCAGARMPR